MILLLGGTSDARRIAARLAESGRRVLVSQATEVSFEMDADPNLEVRAGPLDEAGLAALIERRAIRAIVDATHPYATAVRRMARQVAQRKGIAYLSFVRPAVLDRSEAILEFAADHHSAAAAAFAHGRAVLLTVGTRNLGPYAEQSRWTGLPLVVRALDHADSLEACRRAGVAMENVLAGRGPFSVEENRRHIQQFHIGVLVTKDSGGAGGTVEKVSAARAEGCRVVVVERPAQEQDHVFCEVDAILQAVAEIVDSEVDSEIVNGESPK